MRILCLEQGAWRKPTDFPSNFRDSEAQRFTDFAISPNRRGRATDDPINDADSPMKITNFNGVGGGTILYARALNKLGWRESVIAGGGIILPNIAEAMKRRLATLFA